MHRSGTSLVAQWLNAMGMHLGNTFLEGNFSNEKGHFEDMDFLQLHRQILRENNLHPSGLRLIQNLVISDDQREKMKKLVIQKNSENNQWGWKEPRTCLFLDEYNQIITRAKYLIVYRNFNEVINSLVKRDLKELRNKTESGDIIRKGYYFLKYNIYRYFRTSKKQVEYLKTTLRYYDKIITFLSGINKDDYILCRLEDFNEHHEQIFNKLQNWGFQLTYMDFGKVFDEKLLHKQVSTFQYPADLINRIQKKENRLNQLENI